MPVQPDSVGTLLCCPICSCPTTRSASYNGDEIGIRGRRHGHIVQRLRIHGANPLTQAVQVDGLAVPRHAAARGEPDDRGIAPLPAGKSDGEIYTLIPGLLPRRPEHYIGKTATLQRAQCRSQAGIGQPARGFHAHIGQDVRTERPRTYDAHQAGSCAASPKSLSRASRFTLRPLSRSASCDTGVPFQRIEQSPPPLETTVTTAAGSWPCGFADPLLSPDGEQAAVSISSRAGAPFRIRSLPVSAIVSRGCTGGKPGGPDFAWLEDRRSGAHDRFMSPSLIVAVAIIAFAAAFHLHWALGGRLGYSVSLPQRLDGTPVKAGRIGWWRPAAGASPSASVLLGALTLTVAGRLDLPLPTTAARRA